MPHPVRPHPRIPAALAALPLLALVAAAAASMAGPHAVHAQGGTLSFFPDVHTNTIRYALLAGGRGPDASARTDASDRIGPAGVTGALGQEGYGRTVIEVANAGDDDASTTLRIYTKFDGASAATTGGTVGAGRVAAYDLTILANQAGQQSFGAELTTTAPVQAIARTRWSSGAGVAWETAPASRALLLPLMAVNIGSQSSVLALQNAAPGSGNLPEIKIYDPATGAVLVSFPEPLADHQVAEWDTSVETNLFGPEMLAPNAAGGFIGPLRVSGSRALAMLGYIDDHGGPATAGIVARPVDAADTVQVLPRVRGGADGGTLIAIANASERTVQATLRFAADDGGTGAVPPERKLTIPGFGAAYIDLSPGGRSVPAVAAPAPFTGSALISATGPVLAAALEDWRVGGLVNAMAGYNAFGPRDLSVRWSAPVIRRATDYVSTELVIHNPAPDPTTARVRLYDATGQGRGDSALTLAGGATEVVHLATADAFPIGTGRASVEADSPVAVVIYERRDASHVYPPKPLDFGTEDERGSMVKSEVRMTPEGADLRVTITLTEGSTGTSFTAHIQNSTCSTEDAPAAYPLTDVVAGRSSTVLTNVDLRALADGRHAVRLLRPAGGRFGGRVSCGIIPEVRGVEVADTTAVGALALEPGPAALPTAAPTSAGVPTTAVPTATRGAATPTFVADVAARIYLPLARKDGR